MRDCNQGRFRQQVRFLQRQFLQDGDLPFSDVLSEEFVEEALTTVGVVWNDSVYTPMVTLWVFLSQVLSADHSCRAAVARLISHRLSSGLRPCSPETGAYCQARKRLPEKFFSMVSCMVGRALDKKVNPKWLWNGRRVYMFDGSVIRMPDTAANLRSYTKTPNQKAGLGFLIARLGVITSLSCGAILGVGFRRYSGKGQSELNLLREMWNLFEPGDVLLADRLMCSWREMVMLKQQGVDSVTRLCRRTADFRRGKRLGKGDHIVRWHLTIGGQIIFCEICKAIRSTKLVVANITTTNFNVLFELGFAIGLGKPVLPVRDTSYNKDKKVFDEIGIFDTLGYEQFTSSKDLSSLVQKHTSANPVVNLLPDLNRRQPIYYIRAPYETDGSIKLLSALKKGYFRFRTFDPKEVMRLSLHEAVKQTMSSISVIAHLIDPEREGSVAHNSRAAFVCGMALAAGRNVLMLQEGSNPQPIDYRDIVVPYSDPNTIPFAVERIVRSTADSFQSDDRVKAQTETRSLEKLDLGDVAAENEIQSLRNYFVRTPQFQLAKQGHARLVVGRKGAGKTNIGTNIGDTALCA